MLLCCELLGDELGKGTHGRKGGRVELIVIEAKTEVLLEGCDHGYDAHGVQFGNCAEERCILRHERLRSTEIQSVMQNSDYILTHVHVGTRKWHCYAAIHDAEAEVGYYKGMYRDRPRS